ncbi:MAG: hypothetical protein J6A15_01055 [Clostridia bacterium]|nr:hypothetical protein [Clostridia bacterium]
MQIYIDDREKDKERIEAIKNEFHCDVEMKRLIAGDILVEQNNAPTIAIEVKTIQDFIKSCRDRQIQKEALNMKKIYPFSFIILYDNDKWNKKYTKPQTLSEKYGNIVSLTQRYKTPVIQCYNTNHFLKCIKAIISNVNKDDIPIEQPNVRKKHVDDRINVLIGLKKVGEKTAKTLLEHFGSPRGVLNATDEELDTVPRLYKESKESIRRCR